MEQLPGVVFSVPGLEAWDRSPSFHPSPSATLPSAQCSRSQASSQDAHGHALRSPGSLLCRCLQTRRTGHLRLKGARTEHHREAGTAQPQCLSLPPACLRGLRGRACTAQRPSSLETQTCQEAQAHFGYSGQKALCRGTEGAWCYQWGHESRPGVSRPGCTSVWGHGLGVFPVKPGSLLVS